MPLDGSTIVDQTGQEILDALELLRRDGWCTGIQMNEKGQRCALGAIFHVEYNEFNSPQDYNIPIVRRLAIATGSVNPNIWQSPTSRALSLAAAISIYNNSRTSFDEIEDWFLRAVYAY